MINRDSGIRNIPELFLPFVINSSIPKTPMNIPSNRDGIGLFENCCVIKPYNETVITNTARTTLIIFDSIPPQPFTSFIISMHIYQLK